MKRLGFIILVLFLAFFLNSCDNFTKTTVRYTSDYRGTISDEFYTDYICRFYYRFLDYNEFTKQNKERELYLTDASDDILGQNTVLSIEYFELGKNKKTNDEYYTLSIEYGEANMSLLSSPAISYTNENNTLNLECKYLGGSEKINQKIYVVINTVNNFSLSFKINGNIIESRDFGISNYEVKVIGDKELELVSYHHSYGNVIVPDQIGEYKVTSISPDVFNEFNERGYNLHNYGINMYDAVYYFGNKENPHLVVYDFEASDNPNRDREVTIDKNAKCLTTNWHKNANIHKLSVPKGMIVTDLATPKKDGYEFVCWDNYENGDYITYEAKFEPIVYTITYDLNYGVNNPLNPTTFTIEDEFVIYPPTRENAEFECWYLDGNHNSYYMYYVYQKRQGKFGDILLVAKWANNTTTFATLYADLKNEVPTIHERPIGEKDTFMTPSIDGYTFGGWYLSNEHEGDLYTYDYGYYDKEYYAKWIPNTYTLTYQTNGGIISSTSQSFTNGTDSLLVPTSDTYEFIGWYLEITFDTLVDDDFIFTKDTTLYAKWE